MNSHTNILAWRDWRCSLLCMVLLSPYSSTISSRGAEKVSQHVDNTVKVWHIACMNISNRNAITHTSAAQFFLAPENHHEDGKLYQVNRGVQAVYNTASRALEALEIDGQPVQDDGRYTICLLEHHYKNAAVALNLSREELARGGKPQVVTTSARDVLEEYLGAHPNLSSQVEGRLIRV